MKVLFIEAIRKDLKLNKKTISLLGKLPNNLNILYTIQYKSLAKEVRNIISSQKNIKHFRQVLGCTDVSNLKDPIFLIGSGKFHATQLALSSNQPVYILEGEHISKINNQDIKHLQKKKKTALMKFYDAKEVGILVSTKPGQENFKKALNLQKQLEHQGKNSFIFIANDINISEFENFSCDIWVNTACPGLSLDSTKIINIKDLKF